MKFFTCLYKGYYLTNEGLYLARAFAGCWELEVSSSSKEASYASNKRLNKRGGRRRIMILCSDAEFPLPVLAIDGWCNYELF